MATAELTAAAPARLFGRIRIPAGPAMAVVSLAAGLAVILTPYQWSEVWQFSGFDLGLWTTYAWQLLPFALVAVACVVRLGIRHSVARALILAMVAAMLAAEWYTNNSVAFENPAFTWLPAALSGGVAAVWLTERIVVGVPRAARLARVYPTLCWIGAGAALLAVGRTLPIEHQPTISTFVLLFTSIVIEALPFVLFGAAVSAALEVLVPGGWFERLANKPLHVQIPAAIASGFAFPVCECGSVPVARRLILRGLHPTAGLAFMLAAPIVNPVVVVSTAIAFQGRNQAGMVGARLVLGVVLATTVALLMGRQGGGTLLRVRQDEQADHDHGDHCEHDHGGRMRRYADHVGSDFFFMGKFVVAGGALAALAQTVVPQSFFTGLLTTAIFGSLVLMLAAFTLSLCSEADAFVALSFIQFPVAAQLSFLVFGPVLDIKLAMLYRATFGRRFVLRLVLLTVPLVLVTTWLAQLVIA